MRAIIVIVPSHLTTIPTDYTLVGSTIATQHIMPTHALTVSKTPVSTDMTDGKSSTEDDGVPAAVFASVGGMLAMIALILVVILLIVFLMRKNRNYKDG